jgi:hypothetical protein
LPAARREHLDRDFRHWYSLADKLHIAEPACNFLGLEKFSDFVQRMHVSDMQPFNFLSEISELLIVLFRERHGPIFMTGGSVQEATQVSRLQKEVVTQPQGVRRDFVQQLVCVQWAILVRKQEMIGLPIIANYRRLHTSDQGLN